MLIESYSHNGSVRKNNEDMIFADAELGLAVVADGIGGQEAGEVASAIAVSLVEDKIRENTPGFSADILKEAFFEANHTIFSMGKEDEAKHGMGTTMTAAWFKENKILIVHVGDSRAYLCHENSIELLTNDHSLAGELVKDGNITPEQAAHHPQRNILTRSLGHETLVKVDEICRLWEKGDYLVLCSDGLYTLVDDEEILAILNTNKSLNKACHTLVEMALSRGGYDNISVVLVYNGQAVTA